MIDLVRLALEKETSGETNRGCAVDTLRIAEQLACALIDGTEGLEREAKRGPWSKQA